MLGNDPRCPWFLLNIFNLPHEYSFPLELPLHLVVAISPVKRHNLIMETLTLLQFTIVPFLFRIGLMKPLPSPAERNRLMISKDIRRWKTVAVLSMGPRTMIPLPRIPCLNQPAVTYCFQSLQGIVFCLLISVACSGRTALAQLAPTGSGDAQQSSTASTNEQKSQQLAPSREEIEGWINLLQSDSYASRKHAYQLLEPHPMAVIPVIRQSIARVDQEAASSMIRLLSNWCHFPDEGYGRIAYEALVELAQNKITTKSALASNSIASIKSVQSRNSTDLLKSLDAYLDRDTIQVVTSNKYNEYILRLDDSFQGTAEDLSCVRWLEDVELVRLDGKRADRSWLEKIVQIPNLRVLQLRHTSIKSEDLELLRDLESLDTLEIMYTPIDDAAVAYIGQIPLWGNMRLFGTNITPEGIEKIKLQLEGAKIIYGRGGFLGIGSTDMGLDITQVSPNSGAEKAGVRLGDRILKMNGVPLKKFDELRNELAKYVAGDTVELEVERIEREFNRAPKRVVRVLPVVLGEQP